MKRWFGVGLLAPIVFACGGSETDPSIDATGDAAGCTDECTGGAQTCDGTGAYRVCGQYDLDACLEPSPPINCAAGYACAGDTCVPPCRDECPVGETLCGDATTVL